MAYFFQSSIFEVLLTDRTSLIFLVSENLVNIFAVRLDCADGLHQEISIGVGECVDMFHNSIQMAIDYLAVELNLRFGLCYPPAFVNIKYVIRMTFRCRCNGMEDAWKE